MVLSAVLQISTVLAAVLTLVWHQTRTVERLRKEVRRDHNRLLKLHAKSTRQARKDNDKLRADFTASNDKLRAEFTASHDKLWDAMSGAIRKLDRIEGFLGIGMPAPAAGRAPGAAFGAAPPRTEDQPREPHATTALTEAHDAAPVDESGEPRSGTEEVD